MCSSRIPGGDIFGPSCGPPASSGTASLRVHEQRQLGALPAHHQARGRSSRLLRISCAITSVPPKEKNNSSSPVQCQPGAKRPTSKPIASNCQNQQRESKCKQARASKKGIRINYDQESRPQKIWYIPSSSANFMQLGHLCFDGAKPVRESLVSRVAF